MEGSQLIFLMIFIGIILYEEEKKKRKIIYGNESIKNVLKQNIGKNCCIAYNVNGMRSGLKKGKCKGEVVQVFDKAVEVIVKNKKGNRTEILNISYINNIRVI